MKAISILAATLAITLTMVLPAHAYYSTLDTGDLVDVQKYRASLEPQLILNRYDGFNLVSRFDTGINNESSVRAILGFGKVDFQMGGFYKYVPYPDTEKQPAIGGMAGVIFARVNGASELSLRFHPLVSKHFAIDYGDLTPYASLPIGITSRSDETFVPVQIAGGAEFKPNEMDRFRFMAEIGINLNKSFSYISGAVIFDFDDNVLHKR